MDVGGFGNMWKLNAAGGRIEFFEWVYFVMCETGIDAVCADIFSRTWRYIYIF